VAKQYRDRIGRRCNMEEKGRMPLIGEEFPEMEVQTTHGRKKLPDEFKGKWFVLFSHPADFTPVCTTEFVAFQRRFEEFKKLDCELIGLSIDQVFSHIKWVEWIKENLEEEIKFPVIADDTGRVASMLGLIHPNKGTNTVRAVFIVDPEGIIRAMLYYPQELGRNMDEILRMVKGLQTGDEHGVAIPANWPNNELIGDEVIIPPASDEQTAKERSKQYECFDWWFCHKKLRGEQ
jgi:peroxiredoxin (alkyl hydroperoxide reductase subunit C)